MESTIQQITRQDLVKVLMAVKSAIPATIVATTQEKMNKTNNPFYERVTKRQTSNIFINFDYAAAVNRRLVKEGKEADFKPHQRAWGVKIPGTPLVLHKEQYYLECGYLTNNDPKITYFVDKVETDKSVFESYLKPKSSSSSQGLDKEVILRDFMLSSVESITMNGIKYVVID